MDGKHVRRRFARPVLPVATGLVVAAVAAGAVSFTLVGHSSGSEQAASASTGSQVDRATFEQRASRSKDRTEPTRTPAAKKSHDSSTNDSQQAGNTDQGSQSAAVGQSGSCQAGYVATGTTTASGEKFNPKADTGANMTLPFNSKVRITNPQNGKSVVIRINDRGPYSSNRCFDLTSSAYQQIASLSDRSVQIDYVVIS